jgi:hypothetical protein
MVRTKFVNASWKMWAMISLLLLVDWPVGCQKSWHINRYSAVVATALFFDSTPSTTTTSTARHASCPPCNERTTSSSSSTPPPLTIWDRLLDIVLQGAATMETLFRGFSLGFGIRMLKYILLESNDRQVDEYMTTEQIQKRFWMSCICGLAMASFIHGLSLFVPTQLRMNWFET